MIYFIILLHRIPPLYLQDPHNPLAIVGEAAISIHRLELTTCEGCVIVSQAGYKRSAKSLTYYTLLNTGRSTF